MIKLFKPGDKVQVHNGGPVMTVQRYALKHTPWNGTHESDCEVECSWYDLKTGHRSGIFHQLTLTKVHSNYQPQSKQGGYTSA